MPANLQQVAELAGQMRDAMLRVNIEEYLSLVRFEPGRIEARLLDGAPPSLAGELADRLGKWTGQRWVVALSRQPGEPPLAQTRREREAAELLRVQSHPALQTVLETFPEAKVKAIRPKKGSRQ